MHSVDEFIVHTEQISFNGGSGSDQKTPPLPSHFYLQNLYR